MISSRGVTSLSRVFAIGLSLAAAAIASTSAQPPGLRRIVMISIDGLSPRDYAKPSEVKIPALRAVMARGAWSSGVRGVVPTVTYPSHTTLITGVTPAVHGIVDNRILDPEGRAQAAWHWYAEAIRVPTLPGLVHASGGTAAAVSWPVTVGMDIDFNIPEFWRSSHIETLSLLKALSKPRNVLALVEAGRGSPLSWPLTDRDRTDMAKHLLGAVPRGILLLHLLEYDSVQHNEGPRSRAAVEALERIDSYISELVETVEDQPARHETSIVIVSDHGFRTYDKHLNPNALFKQEGLITTDAAGTITEWQAYYHSSGGGGFVYLKGPDNALGAEALANAALVKARVGALLAGLKEDPLNGIEVLWTREDLHRLGGPPGAAFGIAMADGFYSGQDTRELRRTGPSRGGHGYDPASRDMDAAFIIAGNTVPRRGDIGAIRMTQIAPTLAAMLGVTLAREADKPIW
jgi:predicted AlkP superfamily pyrophosphatase or phosphodiesterase